MVMRLFHGSTILPLPDGRNQRSDLPKAQDPRIGCSSIIRYLDGVSRIIRLPQKLSRRPEQSRGALSLILIQLNVLRLRSLDFAWDDGRAARILFLDPALD